MSINKDDFFKILISVILSLIAIIGQGIRCDLADIEKRMMTVELNQARLMERLGMTDIAKNAANQP